MKTTRYELLKRENLLSWKVIRWAIQNCKINLDDIYDYAIEQMEHDDNGTIAILVCSEESERELRNQIIEKLTENDSTSNIKERWILSALIEIQEMHIGDQEKIDKLQNVYSEFNFPEMLSACSIYYFPPNSSLNIGDKTTDPIIEMENVIQNLRREIEAHRGNAPNPPNR